MAWTSAQQVYEKKLARIESRVIRLLEERLRTATTAEDMFRVFSTFNPLFFRTGDPSALFLKEGIADAPTHKEL